MMKREWKSGSQYVTQRRYLIQKPASLHFDKTQFLYTPKQSLSRFKWRTAVPIALKVELEITTVQSPQPPDCRIDASKCFCLDMDYVY
jgi:hypothetical protein